MKTYASVFLGAVLLALAATPLVVRLARRLRLLDQPSARKVHRQPVPRIGGVAIAIGVFGALLPVLMLHNPIGDALREMNGALVALLAASAFVFLVGFADDLWNLPSQFKLVALVGAALAVCATGTRIESICLGESFALQLGPWAWPATVMW
ncbi:MAG: hypothetical protein ACREIT_06680, partial [Tepidisphaeraceae bacterium]